MGGLIIILGTLFPVLLLTKFDNIYIILLILTTLWMGFIGFVDDFIKVKKRDKQLFIPSDKIEQAKKII